MVFGNDVKEYVYRHLMRGDSPSIVIQLSNVDSPVYKLEAGYRDVENDLPANIDTIYGIASVTKVFTSILTILLSIEGGLSLEDPVSKYFDDDFKTGGESIRVWNLLNHSTGIPALGYVENRVRALLNLENPLPLAGEDSVIEFLSNGLGGWRTYPAGERFLYLNEGYVLMGRILERVTGKAYDELIRMRILDPLKLRRTLYRWEDVVREGNHAYPYVKDGGRWVRIEKPARFYADAGLYSTVEDLSRLGLSLASGDIGGVDSLEIVDLMRRFRIGVGDKYGESYYGLGIGISKLPDGSELYSHSGSLLYFNSYLAFSREHGTSIALLANGPGLPLRRIGLYILARFLGIDPLDIDDIRLDTYMDKAVGRYTLFRGGFHAEVVRRGDQLYLKYPASGGYMEYALLPVKADGDRLVFNVYSGGRLYEGYIEYEGEDVWLSIERYVFKRV